MTDPKQPRKQRKSKEPLPIEDLELNKETVADLTEAQAEHVQGGRRMPDGSGLTVCDLTCTVIKEYCVGCK
jgi:hypothetical protein